MSEFMEVWETERIPELDECVRALESELCERQKIELQEFRTRLAAEPYKPKFSPGVLDMQRRMDCMGRQEMYPNAKNLKKEIQDSREKELARNHETRLERMKRKEAHFVGLQMKEKSALIDNIRALRMDKARQQEREFQALAKQHASRVAYVRARQANERSRLVQEVS